MDITVYLPDELGQWAKAAGLNLSAELRAAVQAERERQVAREASAGAPYEIELDLEDDATGRAYTGRFQGVVIAEGDDVTVYLKDDDEKTVLVYDHHKPALHDLSGVDEAEALRQWLDDGPYIEACHALGIHPVVDV